MDVQGILGKIESDAREAASRVFQDAQKRVGEIHAQAEAQDKAQREAMNRRIQAERAEMESRMLRMAELEDKKAQLAVKREVMDGAFALAVRQLRKLPDERKRAFFRDQLLNVAQGDEALWIGSEDSVWFTDDFLSDVNAALEKAGTPGRLTREGSVDGCGFELRRGGESLRCTFEALVEGSRLALEGDVARALFDD